MKFVYILITALVFITVGCGEKAKIPDRGRGGAKKCSPEKTISLSLDGTYSYQNDIVTIMNSHCVSCHGVGGTSPNLTTETNVINSGNSVYQYLGNGHKGSNGSADAAKFKTWLDEHNAAAANTGNTGNTGNTSDTNNDQSNDDTEEKVTFDQVSNQILKASCDSCHGGNGAGGVITDDKDKFDEAAAKSTYDLFKGGDAHKGKTVNNDQLDMLKLFAESFGKEDSDEAKENGKDADATAKTASEDSSSGCDDSSADATAVAKDGDYLKACHDKGFLYDRRRTDSTCHSASLGGLGACTWDTVAKYLGSIEGFSRSDLKTKYEDEGWSVDQCGKKESHPVFMLIKSGETVGVKILTTAPAKTISD